MKASLLCLLMSLALNHCAEKFATQSPASETLTIRSGTSYGFCVGYCQRTLVVTGTDAAFTKTGNQVQAQYPPVTCKSTLPTAEWMNLKALADLSLLRKQPTTLGCPDCADGGAEFLEIEQGTDRYRVTFDAGSTIPGFDALVTALRAKQKTFDTCQ